MNNNYNNVNDGQNSNNNPQQYIQQGSQIPGKSFGTAGMICSIIGLVFWFFPHISLIMGTVGMVLACISISDRKNPLFNLPPLGTAKAGLICGILSIISGFLCSYALDINVLIT